MFATDAVFFIYLLYFFLTEIIYRYLDQQVCFSAAQVIVAFNIQVQNRRCNFHPVYLYYIACNSNFIRQFRKSYIFKIPVWEYFFTNFLNRFEINKVTIIYLECQCAFYGTGNNVVLAVECEF